ncbi:hypothetical protein MRX96_011267 [Rhipicephalus microplus]
MRLVSFLKGKKAECCHCDEQIFDVTEGGKGRKGTQKMVPDTAAPAKARETPLSFYRRRGGHFVSLQKCGAGIEVAGGKSGAHPRD